MMDPIAAVLDEIQRGYADAAQTELDRTVATNIVRRLRSAGWFDQREVATIVKAAGGRVVVTQEAMAAVEQGAEVVISYEPDRMRYMVEVRP